jgi:DNA primase large subunit
MLSLKNKMLMTVAAIGLLSAGGAFTAANAQDGYMSQQGQQQQMNVTDAQLQEFVEAQAAIDRIQSQFQERAASITSQEEMTNLQEQTNKQMVQAIEQTDLSVQEYNQIARLVQADPQTQEKYMELIR